ncbi:Ankyrin repeat-containing domain protein [Naviculisporaceae sp. PSN 640]
MQDDLAPPSTISERRRLQNRNAQRRFRQRREKQSNLGDTSGRRISIPFDLHPGETPSYLTVANSYDNSFPATDFSIENFLATPAITPSTEGTSESEISTLINQSISSSSASSSSSIPPSSASTPGLEYSQENDQSYFMSSEPALSPLSSLPITPITTISQTYHDAPPSSSYEYLGVLHIAAQKGHSRIIQMLLSQQKLDCNAPDSEGRTPLMHGVIAGHAGVVQALLAVGARCDAVDYMQRSALHLAVLYRREHILRLLLTEIRSGIGDGHSPVGLVAAGFGFLLDAYDAEGNTPMHLAVAGGFEAGVAMLLQSGADLAVQARRS